MIAIIDYGTGNLRSIQNMLKRVGAEANITSNIDEISNADKLILPGVGAFDNAIDNMNKFDIWDVIYDKVQNQKTPILGICLGLHLLGQSSEEGRLKGFGFINYDTVRFDFNSNPANLKIPHMGWNTVAEKKNSKLFKNMHHEPRFYFVHSYHLKDKEDDDVLCTSCHDYEFISAVEKNNIFGVQFHPEKSHKFGMQLLKNFAEFV